MGLSQRRALILALTPPFNTTAGFIAGFVEPLLGGGRVHVEAPLSSHDRRDMLADASPLLDSELLHLRTRVAQRLVADPSLPDPGADELSLWLGLHDVLALDHPDTDRVWTRDKTWRAVEAETRSLLAFSRPTELAEALARHLAVGAFLQLEREDHIVADAEGEHRFRGQEPPKRRFGLFRASYADVRSEQVRWVEQPHRPMVERLLPDVMWVSPLTALLEPRWAPPGWSPLMAVEFLRSRGYARAVCHAWAREPEWLRLGGVVAGSLLRALELHGPVFGGPGDAAVPGRAAAMRRAEERVDGPRDPDLDWDPGSEDEDEDEDGLLVALPPAPVRSEPEDIGAVIGALIHLHVLKVLEFDARISIGLGARDWAVQTFLALPLLLGALAPVLGRPLEGAPDEAFVRRWEEYCDHLAGLVPRTVVDKLLATLVQRVVERQSA